MFDPVSDADVDYTERAMNEWQRIHPTLDLDSFAVGVRVLRVAARLRRHLEESVQRLGFPVLGDYEVASSLRRAQRPLTPSDIAGRLMLTRAGVTGRLDRLEAIGYVARRQSTDDGRRVLVHLLPKGRRATDRAFKAVTGMYQKELGVLDGAEQSRLAELLTSITRSADPPPQ